jgi:dihydrofolate reductase
VPLCLCGGIVRSQQPMIISLIAAMDESRSIGIENRLPWNVPADMRRFRALTMGHPVIMGRNTYESIGKPLPGRKNIVITRQPDYRSPGCTVVHDLPAAFAAAEGAEEVFVLGGEKLFRDTISVADRIYLTVVKARIGGDARFPELPEDFTVVSRETVVDVMPLEFLLYERKPGKERSGA